jgi:uncharacterized protein YuzE
MIEMRYDPEADALAVELRPGASSARTVRVSDTVRADFDARGRLLGLEVLNASWHLDRKTLNGLPSGDDWLSLAEAEHESGLRATTLRVLLHRGRLVGEKRGRDWFVKATALFNYLESREAQGRRPTSAKARRRAG